MPKTEKKEKIIRAKNSKELSEALGLSPDDAAEIEFSVTLNDKIIEVVKKKKLTHVQVAKLAKAGRTKITAIMNRNLHNVSVAFLLKVLRALGYKVSPKISKVA